MVIIKGGSSEKKIILIGGYLKKSGEVFRGVLEPPKKIFSALIKVAVRTPLLIAIIINITRLQVKEK